MARRSVVEFTTRDAPGSIRRLLFGRPAEQDRSGPDTVYRFTPGDIFAAVWWRRLSGGRQHRILAVLGGLEDPPARIILPGLKLRTPIQVMLDQHGPAGQDGAIDEFTDHVYRLQRAGIDPADLTPGYYRRAACAIMSLRRPPYPTPAERHDRELTP